MEESQPLTQNPERAPKYALDPSQALRAAEALIKKIRTELLAHTSGPRDLLADSDEPVATPIWLVVTTKKHVTSKPHLKPSKIQLPHPLPIPRSSDGRPAQKICLITTDPQRYYKDLVAHESFPADVRDRIGRVLGLTKLKSKYKSFESRRQLFAEYDFFLADDRVVTYLPKLLGKVFYGSGLKRPIPVNLQGKRLDIDVKGEKRVALAKGGNKSVRAAPSTEVVGKELRRAVDCAVVSLSPGTNISVKVGTSDMQGDEICANLEATMEALTSKHIPKGWRNVRALYIKGPKTQSLPIWMADELWAADEDILENDPAPISNGLRNGGETTEVSDASRSNRDKSDQHSKSGKRRRLSQSASNEQQQKLEAAARKKARRDKIAATNAEYKSSAQLIEAS